MSVSRKYSTPDFKKSEKYLPPARQTWAYSDKLTKNKKKQTKR